MKWMLTNMKSTKEKGSGKPHEWEKVLTELVWPDGLFSVFGASQSSIFSFPEVIFMQKLF